MKTALITGITGQEGSYLTELLLSKSYQVHGIIRRSSSINTERIDHLRDNPNLFQHYGDITDGISICKLIYEIMPDEVYNLAAQSHVRLSYDMPNYSIETGGLGVINLLEAIKNINKKIRFYQASSSELFGNEPPPQFELTRIAPVSPYGIAKAAGYFATKMYREAYGMFTVNGILFNHESPRRAETFLTRKVTKALARIKHGLQDKLYLGNLSASRDWGYAPDYVEAMHLMLQVDKPDDFVIATSYMHTVSDFVHSAFTYANLDINKYLVSNDPRYIRPIEVERLCGDYSKALKALNWQPTVNFSQLVKIMVDAEMEAIQNKLAPEKNDV
jgi:GDPmannose 4,6-dehydratase